MRLARPRALGGGRPREDGVAHRVPPLQRDDLAVGEALVGEEAEEEVTTLLGQVISGATARCLDPAAVSAAELLAVLDGE